MSKALKGSAAYSEQRRRDIDKYADSIQYSERYSGKPTLQRDTNMLTLLDARPDDLFEYRHVILPRALAKYLPADRLAQEDEWRGLGIRQRCANTPRLSSCSVNSVS